MQRTLPALVATLFLATACTSGPPSTQTGQGSPNNGSSLTTVAPLSAAEAAMKTKEGLASLNAALASLRDLKSSSAVTPKGQAASLQQAAAGYRLYSVLSTDEFEDELPEVGYDEVQWYHDVKSSAGATVGNEYVLTEEILEEGRVASASGEVVVEQYVTTVTTRLPSTSYSGEGEYDDAWGATGGTYTRDEQVTVSEFRKLGRYVTTGTMSVVGGKPLMEATQDFTPKGGTQTYRLTFKTTFDDNTMAFTVKGDAPGGGTIDLTSTAAFTMTGQSTSGSFTQKGTIVTAKNETILVDCSLSLTSDLSSQTPSFSTKGALTLTFKDKLVLKLDFDAGTAGDQSSGAIYAADGTTRQGTISIGSSESEGVITFNDGTTQTINLQTLDDLMSTASSVTF